MEPRWCPGKSASSVACRFGNAYTAEWRRGGQSVAARKSAGRLRSHGLLFEYLARGDMDVGARHSVPSYGVRSTEHARRVQCVPLLLYRYAEPEVSLAGSLTGWRTVGRFYTALTVPNSTAELSWWRGTALLLSSGRPGLWCVGGGPLSARVVNAPRSGAFSR